MYFPWRWRRLYWIARTIFLRSPDALPRFDHAFRDWLHGLTPPEFGVLEVVTRLAETAGTLLLFGGFRQALFALHNQAGDERERRQVVCATYLLQHGPASEATLDPVARFHLYNGARLERIDFLADTSKKGVRESLGLMVNYTYDPDTITANHDKFVRSEVVASRKVRNAALA